MSFIETHEQSADPSNPATNKRLLYSKNDGWYERGATGAASRLGPTTSFEVTGSSNISTTSTSYVQIPDLTYTPPAGTYLVLVSLTLTNTTASGVTNLAIGKANTAIGITRKVATTITGGANQGIPSNTQALVTVNGAEAISAMWSASAGTAYSAFGRSLILVRVA